MKICTVLKQVPDAEASIRERRGAITKKAPGRGRIELDRFWARTLERHCDRWKQPAGPTERLEQ